MKVGDLVRYRGWTGAISQGPIGIVTEINHSGPVSFHTRVRVTWSGDDLPIQASALSVDGGRTTTWVHPKHFEIVEDG